MISLISSSLPYIVLFFHIVFVFLLLALFFRNSWGRDTILWLGRHAIFLVFAVSLIAVLGSLFYSEIMGFEPCVLCWWQRVFLYPLVILFALALQKRDSSVFTYAIYLALFAAVISTYQSYVYLGGISILSCTALDSACSKVYVKEFGYITIPMMSLTVSLYILLIAWAHRIYDKNRNT